MFVILMKAVMKMWDNPQDDDVEDVLLNLKALEEVRLDAERGIFMFNGALGLLVKQLDDVTKGACPVCRRGLTTKKLSQQCLRHLEAKKESVIKIRNEDAVLLHENCVTAIKELGAISDGQQQQTPSSTRLAFYVRTGELSEWRQQKLDCMANMSCFACGRRFMGVEYSDFLKRVDHRAAVMERELHIHPKFCPIESSDEPRKRMKMERSKTESGRTELLI